MAIDIETLEVSSMVVAAICGCWRRESLVNPGIWESLIPVPWDYMHTSDPLAGGFGFGQWTNTGPGAAMRCLNLHNWVTSNGYSDGDGAGQIAYFLYENIWYYTSSIRGNYRTLEEFLTSDSDNLDDLVWDFLAGWEGVPGDAYEERRQWAHTFHDYITAHADDDPADYAECISGNWYNTPEQTLHNVMFVYFALNGYLKEGTISPTKFLLLAIAGRRSRLGRVYRKRIRI